MFDSWFGAIWGCYIFIVYVFWHISLTSNLHLLSYMILLWEIRRYYLVWFFGVLFVVHFDIGCLDRLIIFLIALVLFSRNGSCRHLENLHKNNMSKHMTNCGKCRVSNLCHRFSDLVDRYFQLSSMSPRVLNSEISITPNWIHSTSINVQIESTSNYRSSTLPPSISVFSRFKYNCRTYVSVIVFLKWPNRSCGSSAISKRFKKPKSDPSATLPPFMWMYDNTMNSNCMSMRCCWVSSSSEAAEAFDVHKIILPSFSSRVSCASKPYNCMRVKREG